MDVQHAVLEKRAACYHKIFLQQVILEAVTETRGSSSPTNKLLTVIKNYLIIS